MARDIRLLTLDLDNTLWDVDSTIIDAEKSMRQWMQAHAPESLEHYTPEALTDHRHAVVEAHPEKVHDLSFMRTAVLTRVMNAAGYDNAQTLAQSAFDVFFAGRNRVVFFPGAIASLAELKKNFTIYALTNGNADIQRAGLSDYLHGAISSADVGKSKPHPEMFKAPLRKLDLSPHQAIHIGDNLVDDIAGALNVGMYTVWVNLTSSSLADTHAQPHQEINHLKELPGAIADIIDH